MKLKYEYPCDREGIEREQAKTTSGVHWTQEELKEWVAKQIESFDREWNKK